MAKGKKGGSGAHNMTPAERRLAAQGFLQPPANMTPADRRGIAASKRNFDKAARNAPQDIADRQRRNAARADRDVSRAIAARRDRMSVAESDALDKFSTSTRKPTNMTPAGKQPQADIPRSSGFSSTSENQAVRSRMGLTMGGDVTGEINAGRARLGLPPVKDPGQPINGFEDFEHPRHPAGTSKGGEFKKK
jgi:hypothetical protein